MRPTDIDVHEHRRPEHEVGDLFLSRWSPRALAGEDLPHGELMALFEAARWAPSSYNGQPWRFVYARRGTEHWDRLFELMVEFNQQWAQGAAALVVVISRTTFERNGKPARTHSFDTGAAWMSLALEATRRGLVAHAMQGFDYDRAREALGVGEEFSVEAMVAIGRPGQIEDLPEGMRDKEIPSGRRPLSEIVFEGTLGGR